MEKDNNLYTNREKSNFMYKEIFHIYIKSLYLNNVYKTMPAIYTYLIGKFGYVYKLEKTLIHIFKQTPEVCIKLMKNLYIDLENKDLCIKFFLLYT